MAKRHSLTHAKLKSLLRYEPESGLFFWLVDGKGQNRVRAGDIAGSINAGGYVVITIGRKRYYAHRLAWFYVRKRWPKFGIDHHDGIGDNNRWGNLRDANQSMNMQNLQGPRSDNKLRILGVHEKTPGRFVAQIVENGQRRWIGVFDTTDLAKEAYEEARKQRTARQIPRRPVPPSPQAKLL